MEQALGRIRQVPSEGSAMVETIREGVDIVWNEKHTSFG